MICLIVRVFVCLIASRLSVGINRVCVRKLTLMLCFLPYDLPLLGAHKEIHCIPGWRKSLPPDDTNFSSTLNISALGSVASASPGTMNCLGWSERLGMFQIQMQFVSRQLSSANHLVMFIFVSGCARSSNY